MTLRQIAALCEVDHSTVCRWAGRAAYEHPELSRKMQEATAKKKAAQYTLEEVLWIITAGNKGPLPSLLLDNAKHQAPIPSGAQLHELRMMAKEGIISSLDIKHLLGLNHELVTRPSPIPITDNSWKSLLEVSERGNPQPELEGL